MHIFGGMKNLRRHGKTSRYFPKEIIPEILEKLPVKYLIPCMLVQKSWYYLIRTPQFVTAHYNYQKLHHNYLLFDSVNTSLSPLVLRVDDDVRCEEQDVVPLPYPQYLSRRLSFYSVCNGLICFATGGLGYYTQIWLWNPAIRKLKPLPVPLRPKIPGFTEMVSLAFGFCPKDNDIKVVYLRVTPNAPDNPYPVADVFSLSTNSWKTTNNNLLLIEFLSSTDGLLLNGTAFFTGRSVDREHIIVIYDTDKDTMKMISFPEYGPAHAALLKEFGKSVALFLRNPGCGAFNVWILKQGTTNEVCWEKRFSFNFPERFWIMVGIRSNGEVILGNSSGLVSYNVENNETKDFGWLQLGPHYFMHSFTESLVMINT